MGLNTHRLAIDWPRLWPHLVAWLLILSYIFTFTWLAILRHASFNSSGFDLGIYDQVVWNTLHGRVLFYTTTGQPLLHLSNHASPILILIAPFYLIYSGPQMLLFLQTAAIGLGPGSRRSSPPCRRLISSSQPCKLLTCGIFIRRCWPSGF